MDRPHESKYFNHLVISAPSRSGTTHLTVETILQAYGWEKGWALLLNAGGNMGSITDRSFGVPSRRPGCRVSVSWLFC
jgi:ABC-type Fe3+ transport system substrate-binding protein